jgi:hypothetical protein
MPVRRRTGRASFTEGTKLVEPQFSPKEHEGAPESQYGNSNRVVLDGLGARKLFCQRLGLAKLGGCVLWAGIGQE